MFLSWARFAGVAAALGMGGFVGESTAHAADPPPSTPPAAAASDARLAYMDSVLGYYTAESSRHRTWNAALGLARGAIAVPVGGFILSRELVAPGVVLIANGALAAGSGLLDLLVYRQPAEELRAHFLARRASSASVDEILDETEREWVVKANAVRQARIRSGVLSLGVGTLLTGLGALVGFNVIDVPSSTIAFGDRATFSSLLIGFGGMNISSGARSLLIADPIESGWQSYTRARSVWGSASLQFVALNGGGYVGVTGRF